MTLKFLKSEKYKKLLLIYLLCALKCLIILRISHFVSLVEQRVGKLQLEGQNYVSSITIRT